MNSAGFTLGPKWDLCALCGHPLLSGPFSLVHCLRLFSPLLPLLRLQWKITWCPIAKGAGAGFDVEKGEQQALPLHCALQTLLSFYEIPAHCGFLLTDKPRKSQGWKITHNPFTAAKIQFCLLPFAVVLCEPMCDFLLFFLYPASRSVNNRFTGFSVHPMVS